jgi:hypothetical protein
MSVKQPTVEELWLSRIGFGRTLEIGLSILEQERSNFIV